MPQAWLSFPIIIFASMSWGALKCETATCIKTWDEIAVGSLGQTGKQQQKEGAEGINATLEQVKKTLDANPNNAQARTELGKIYLLQGKVNEAIAEFERSTRDDPGYTQAHIFAAVGLLLQSDLERAEEKLKTVLQIQSSNQIAHCLLGSIYFDQACKDTAQGKTEAGLRKLADAEGEFQSAIKLAYQSSNVLASSHLGLGAINHQRAELYRSLGKTEEANNAVQNAKLAYTEAIKLRPELKEMLNRLAIDLASSAPSSILPYVLNHFPSASHGLSKAGK